MTNYPKFTLGEGTYDLYKLADALGIKSHPHFEAFKKLVRAGAGKKSRELDLEECKQSVDRFLLDLRGETPAAATEADPKEWIIHKGKSCPVMAGTIVDIQYRNGEVKLGLPADQYMNGPEWDASPSFWECNGADNDIFAYRISAIKPAEPAPWSLASHLKQHFGRELTVDERPHRDDFTEAMLEGGWRPLLIGEPAAQEDQCMPTNEWLDRACDVGYRMSYRHCHTRTRRPLPAISA